MQRQLHLPCNDKRLRGSPKSSQTARNRAFEPRASSRRLVHDGCRRQRGAPAGRRAAAARHGPRLRQDGRGRARAAQGPGRCGQARRERAAGAGRSSDPAKAAASTAKFTGAAEQSLVGESVFHHFHDNDGLAAHDNDGLAALSGPNSLSPPRRAADRQARKENILRPKTGSRPGTKDRARWSDESPFLPGGPPPPGTDPVFDRMVEAELANRVNTPRADGDPPADFFK